MYISGNTAALETRISSNAYKVYLVLCRYANNRSRECFVSKNTISQAAEISLSSVVRATKELVFHGLLKIVSRFTGSGRQTSNLYTLLDCPQTRIDTVSLPPQKSTQQTPQTAKTRRFPVPCAALKLPALPCRVYSFLSALAGRSRECTVFRTKIASGCGVSLSSVSRAISYLLRHGFLRCIRQTRWARFGNHGTTANRFVLTAPASRPIGKIRRNLLLISLLAALTPSPLSPVTPLETKVVTKDTLNLRRRIQVSFQEIGTNAARFCFHPARLREKSALFHRIQEGIAGLWTAAHFSFSGFSFDFLSSNRKNIRVKKDSRLFFKSFGNQNVQKEKLIYDYDKYRNDQVY